MDQVGFEVGYFIVSRMVKQFKKQIIPLAWSLLPARENVISAW